MSHHPPPSEEDSEVAREVETDDPRHLWLVLNGKVADDPRIREAVKELRDRGHRLEVRVTWEQGDAVRLAREAVAEGVETVVAGGGDGTLHEVVQGVLEAQDELDRGEPPLCSLGLVPLGTANDFAHSADIPPDPQEALRGVVTTDPHPIDVGRVDGRCFVNVATGGLGAEITSETSEGMKSALGRLAYVLTGLARFRDLRPAKARLRAPDFEWEGTFLALAVGNGRRAGGAMEIFPDARLDDGSLHVLVVPELPPQRRVATLTAFLQQGREAVAQDVLTLEAPWLEVEVPEGLHLNLDGEPVEGASFRFEVDPGRLRFHVGPRCPSVGTARGDG